MFSPKLLLNFTTKTFVFCGPAPLDNAKTWHTNTLLVWKLQDHKWKKIDIENLKTRVYGSISNRTTYCETVKSFHCKVYNINKTYRNWQWKINNEYENTGCIFCMSCFQIWGGTDNRNINWILSFSSFSSSSLLHSKPQQQNKSTNFVHKWLLKMKFVYWYI